MFDKILLLLADLLWRKVIWNTQLVRDDLQIQIMLVAIFLIICGAHVEILIHYRSDDSCGH